MFGHLKVFQTFECVDEFQKCDHSNESYEQYLPVVPFRSGALKSLKYFAQLTRKGDPSSPCILLFNRENKSSSVEKF